MLADAIEQNMVDKPSYIFHFFTGHDTYLGKECDEISRRAYFRSSFQEPEWSIFINKLSLMLVVSSSTQWALAVANLMSDCQAARPICKKQGEVVNIMRLDAVASEVNLQKAR